MPDKDKNFPGLLVLDFWKMKTIYISRDTYVNNKGLYKDHISGCNYYLIIVCHAMKMDMTSFAP